MRQRAARLILGIFFSMVALAMLLQEQHVVSLVAPMEEPWELRVCAYVFVCVSASRRRRSASSRRFVPFAWSRMVQRFCSRAFRATHWKSRGCVFRATPCSSRLQAKAKTRTGDVRRGREVDQGDTFGAARMQHDLHPWK